ncbi:MAG: zinc-binding dehydrogenase [Actinomycetota bacterium]
MGMMKTGQLFGVNDLRCVEAPIPDRRAGEVLVRTHMASICGSDLHQVCHGAGIMHPFPCPHGFPGHEAVGEVVDAGDSELAEGTRVLCFPSVPVSECFSEYQRIDPKYLLPLPEADVSAAELLMAQQLGTVVFAARKNPIDAVGKTVLILGQGSAGLFWTYWLKRHGAARIIVADRAPTRLAASPHYGADVVVNIDDDDLRTVIRDLCGAGADFVVEAVGSVPTLNQTIELVRPDGDLMWFGLPDTDRKVEISYAKFFRKRLTAWSTYGAQEEADAVSFATALDLIARRDIDVSPLLSHIYSVDDIDTAIAVANDPIPEGALKVSVSF